MQFENKTSFPAIGWPSVDRDAKEYISIVVRVKYLFDSLNSDGCWSLKLDQDQEELFEKDIYYEDDIKAHVLFESDYIAYKPHGDLIVNIDLVDPYSSQASVEMKRFKLKRDGLVSDKLETIIYGSGIKKLGVRPRTQKQRSFI